LVLAVLVLTILLGSAAATIDVGRIFIAAERAQSVADSAALAAIPVLTNAPAVEREVTAMVRSNNDSPGGFKVVCRGFNDPTGSDLLLYAPGSTLPGGAVAAGALNSGLSVTCHIYVPHTFARIYGADGAMVSRQATVVKGAMGGGVVTPMWIAENTPVVIGQQQNLLMGKSSIPGNFGFLDLPDGADMSWYDALAGRPFTPATQEALTVGLGDIVDGYTGLSVGLWQRALEERIERAQQAPWTGQTWNTSNPENPRVMLIPMVTYLTDNGTNATYRIERFAAFWLDGIAKHPDGKIKAINGTFMNYETVGMVAPDLNPPSVIAYGLYR